MISKELLSAVIGKEVREIELSNNVNIINYLVIKDDWWYSINIHELAFKCKVWALQYKYELLSGFLSGNGYVVVMEQRRTWHADTEPEAIFEACEYILNQKDEK